MGAQVCRLPPVDLAAGFLRGTGGSGWAMAMGGGPPPTALGPGHCPPRVDRIQVSLEAKLLGLNGIPIDRPCASCPVLRMTCTDQ